VVLYSQRTIAGFGPICMGQAQSRLENVEQVAWPIKMNRQDAKNKREISL
jgi:hypothetical protein